MRKNNLLLLLFGLFGILFLINIISATITVTSPVSYSNFSGSNLISFNVSYVNGTDFTDSKNATFYYNLSGVWTSIGTASVCSNTATSSSCNASLNISSLTDGRYSINATLANSTTVLGASVLTTNVIFDKTPPAVSFSGITNAVNNGNYSGIIMLNVSASDAVIGMSSVYFNITYANGTQVNFTQASVLGNYYNISLNTSTFYDGLYNVTVYANDSLNNLNNSQSIQFIMDNTVPTVSLSCTPATANRGDNMTCTCTGVDATSGISSGSFSDTNPDDSLTGAFTSAPHVISFLTYNTGTFTSSCTVFDSSGNSATTTDTYTVILTSITPSTSSSSTSTTTTNATTTQTNEEVPTTTVQSFDTITPDSPVTMTNFSTDAVKQIQIEVSQNATNVKIQIDKYNSKPAAVLADKPNSYGYLHINAQNLTSLTKAVMTIQVNKTWVSANNLTQNDISLFRYNDSLNQWDELTTTFTSEDANYYYYEIQLNHFSYFAIASNKLSVASSATSSSTPTTSNDYLIWILAGIVIVAIIFVVIKFIQRGKNKKSLGY